jgi:flagellar protein FliO/FliZ
MGWRGGVFRTDGPSVRRSPAHPLLGLRVRVLAFAALVVAALGTPAGAYAEAFKKDTTPLTGLGEPETAATPDTGSSLGRLVIGMLIVGALVVGLRWFLKRANRDRGVKATGSLTVVATTPLAQNRAVHLIRVGDELVLVGSAEQGVTPLRVYSAAETRTLDAQLNADEFVDTNGGNGVGQLLGDLRRRTAR